MARVKFTTAVKYNDASYPAHTPFECDDSDLPKLIIAGAFILTPPVILPSTEEVTEEEAITPSQDPSPVEEVAVEEPKETPAKRSYRRKA